MNRAARNWNLLIVAVLLLSLVFATPVRNVEAAPRLAQAFTGTTYTQNFDTLANTGSNTWADDSTLTGWLLAREVSLFTVLTYIADTGALFTGAFYSYGSTGSTERALGSLPSNGYTGASGIGMQYAGLLLQNTSGSTISSLVVGYTGEQWKANNAAAHTLSFSYKSAAVAPTLREAGYTNVSALNFITPTLTTAGALDGNAAANRAVLSTTITGLSWANDEFILLRWTDLNDSGNDHGLAIDDVSVAIPVDVAPTVSSTTPTTGAIDIALASNLSVTFSEAVTATGDWLTLSCVTSGPHTVVITGGDVTYTIDPVSDFVNSELCTATVLAASIADKDGTADSMAADYVWTFTTIGTDVAPTVSSTTPANGATGVALAADVTVTFSETVTVTDPWFTLSCSLSGSHTAVVTGGPTTFTLNPGTDFVNMDACTLTVSAAQVEDQDTNDPPGNMSADYVSTFSVGSACLEPYTSIGTIQGTGAAVTTTAAGTVVQGVVVGDFEGTSPALRGFFIQDTGDADPLTSDGIFVYKADNIGIVSVGDLVRITGTPGEANGQSQIAYTSHVACGTGTVTPTDVSLPFTSATQAEMYEGMLVKLPQTLTVTNTYYLGRFGEVTLSSGGRLKQPTNVVVPGASAISLQADNNLNQIKVDDSSQTSNPDPILFGGGILPLSPTNNLRGGDTTTNVVGVMTYTWAGNSASPSAYRVRPLSSLSGYVSFTSANPRPGAAPALTGRIRVVGMNVLNYFNTYDGLPDAVDNCTLGVGGAATDCRGADTLVEFDRQWPKTVAAIIGTNADIIGLTEIENDGYGLTSAIQDLVDKLNGATDPGTYAFIDADAGTGVVDSLGSDAIKVAFIYKTERVMPIGVTATLNTIAFVNGGDGAPRNRAALAQAFQEVGTPGGPAGRLVVTVNHLKSKGSACDDADALDGQGNCNIVRTNAANELLAWLATRPTQIAELDNLIIGDLNSYAMEDPITAIKFAGYTNLLFNTYGDEAYSYTYDGQWGYLDHALSNASLTPQVTGVFDYHINSDEPTVLDYNTNFKTAGQQASLYAADQYRASDHDPVLIDLDLTIDAPTAISLSAISARSTTGLPVLPLALGGVLLLAVIVLRKRQ